MSTEFVVDTRKGEVEEAKSNITTLPLDDSRLAVVVWEGTSSITRSVTVVIVDKSSSMSWYGRVNVAQGLLDVLPSAPLHAFTTRAQDISATRRLAPNGGTDMREIVPCLHTALSKLTIDEKTGVNLVFITDGDVKPGNYSATATNLIANEAIFEMLSAAGVVRYLIVGLGPKSAVIDLPQTVFGEFNELLGNVGVTEYMQVPDHCSNIPEVVATFQEKLSALETTVVQLTRASGVNIPMVTGGQFPACAAVPMEEVVSCTINGVPLTSIPVEETDATKTKFVELILVYQKVNRFVAGLNVIDNAAKLTAFQTRLAMLKDRFASICAIRTTAPGAPTGAPPASVEESKAVDFEDVVPEIADEDDVVAPDLDEMGEELPAAPALSRMQIRRLMVAQARYRAQIAQRVAAGLDASKSLSDEARKVEKQIKELIQILTSLFKRLDSVRLGLTQAQIVELINESSKSRRQRERAEGTVMSAERIEWLKNKMAAQVDSPVELPPEQLLGTPISGTIFMLDGAMYGWIGGSPPVEPMVDCANFTLGTDVLTAIPIDLVLALMEEGHINRPGSYQLLSSAPECNQLTPAPGAPHYLMAFFHLLWSINLFGDIAHAPSNGWTQMVFAWPPMSTELLMREELSGGGVTAAMHCLHALAEMVNFDSSTCELVPTKSRKIKLQMQHAAGGFEKEQYVPFHNFVDVYISCLKATALAGTSTTFHWRVMLVIWFIHLLLHPTEVEDRQMLMQHILLQYLQSRINYDDGNSSKSAKSLGFSLFIEWIYVRAGMATEGTDPIRARTVSDLSSAMMFLRNGCTQEPADIDLTWLNYPPCQHAHHICAVLLGPLFEQFNLMFTRIRGSDLCGELWKKELIPESIEALYGESWFAVQNTLLFNALAYPNKGELRRAVEEHGNQLPPIEFTLSLWHRELCTLASKNAEMQRLAAVQRANGFGKALANTASAIFHLLAAYRYSHIGRVLTPQQCELLESIKDDVPLTPAQEVIVYAANEGSRPLPPVELWGPFRDIVLAPLCAVLLPDENLRNTAIAMIESGSAKECYAEARLRLHRNGYRKPRNRQQKADAFYGKAFEGEPSFA